MGYEISLLTVMGISIIGSLSLNLITGFCGQVSLGHAAFVGIGAYTASLSPARSREAAKCVAMR